MTLILAAVLAAVAMPLLGAAVARPARTILPAYAAIVPAGSLVKLSIPIPPPFNTLSSLLGLVAVLAVVTHVVLYRTARVPTLPVALWSTFMAWLSLTVLWAIDPGASLDLALVAWPLVLLMVVVSLLPVDDGDLDAFRIATMVTAIAIGAYALFLLTSGSSVLRGLAEQRFVLTAGGGETDPNILAASLLMPLAVSVERLILGGSRWWRPGTWRALGAMAMFLSIVAIVSTGSRGGVIATLLVVPGVILACRRHPYARPIIRRTIVSLTVGSIALVGAGAISLWLDPTGPVERILSQPPIGRIGQTELGGSRRLEIWLTGYRLCAEHCAIGSGLGTFPTAFNEVFPLSGAGKFAGRDRPAHNIFIELAVESGVVGLSLLMLATIVEWRTISISGAQARAPSLKPMVLGLLLANAFLSTMWFKYFWLVFIMVRIVEGSGARPPPTPSRGRSLERPSARRPVAVSAPR